ncbi:MAG: response regulator [Chlamydiota bacterium]
MRNPNNRFETVPLAEVLEKAVKVNEKTIGASTGPNGGSKGTTVLVVDDERVIADTLGTILRNSGYEAAVSYDAQSALTQCERINPQLIITDVIMPGMDGVEMAMLVRERHPECRILLISGQAATTNLLEDARRRGYDFELLAKPIHPEDLLARLATITSAPAQTSSRG